MSPVIFILEGPKGKEGYEGSEKIAKLINAYLNEKGGAHFD